MTSIHNVKTNKNVNLYDFLTGNRATEYTVQEETGFPTTGNIQALLNSNPHSLRNVYDGIMFNPTNHTNDLETTIGKINPKKHDWTPLKQPQPKTEQIYCDEMPHSELLPFYPNGVPNIVLNPTCDMSLGGTASVTLAGISTMGITDINVLNNPYNNIGHELNPYGIATKYGQRVLGQGFNACQDIGAGLNVPILKTKPNNNGSFISVPTQMNKDIPLYQVDDWSDSTNFPNNFLAEFNNYVGVGCSIPDSDPIIVGPSGPSGPSGRHRGIY
jgi:hypothetical protein